MCLIVEWGAKRECSSDVFDCGMGRGAKDALWQPAKGRLAADLPRPPLPIPNSAGKSLVATFLTGIRDEIVFELGHTPDEKTRGLYACCVEGEDEVLVVVDSEGLADTAPGRVSDAPPHLPPHLAFETVSRRWSRVSRRSCGGTVGELWGNRGRAGSAVFPGRPRLPHTPTSLDLIICTPCLTMHCGAFSCALRRSLCRAPRSTGSS